MAAAHPSPRRRRSRQELAGTQTILYYAALEDRNRSAGQALQLYFKAAELEAQIELLQLTRDDLAGAITKVDELAQEGLSPAERSGGAAAAVARHRGRPDAGRGGVGRGQRPAQGTDRCERSARDDWLWPLIEVPVTFDGVDLDAAVAVALAKRPQAAAPART